MRIVPLAHAQVFGKQRSSAKGHKPACFCAISARRLASWLQMTAHAKFVYCCCPWYQAPPSKDPMMDGHLQAPCGGRPAGSRVQLSGQHHAGDGGGGQDPSADPCGVRGAQPWGPVCRSRLAVPSCHVHGRCCGLPMIALSTSRQRHDMVCWNHWKMASITSCSEAATIVTPQAEYVMHTARRASMMRGCRRSWTTWRSTRSLNSAEPRMRRLYSWMNAICIMELGEHAFREQIAGQDHLHDVRV